MEITVNGKKTEIKRQMRLLELLEARAFREGEVIVEYNGAILPAEDWQTVVLEQGDRLEIVTFVGGG